MIFFGLLLIFCGIFTSCGKKNRGARLKTGSPSAFSDVENIESRLLAYASAHVHIKGSNEHLAGRTDDGLVEMAAYHGALLVRESGVKMEIGLAVLEAEVAV